MRQKVLSTQDGFSLIEVLVAMSIFAIGMLAVVSLQISSMNTNASATRLTEATALASERIERLLALPFEHIDLDPTVPITTEYADIESELGNTGVDAKFEDRDVYEIYWNIAENHFIEDTKTIRVIVAYNNRGEDRQVVLQQAKSR